MPRDFDTETVAPPLPPVRGEQDLEEVSFRVRKGSLYYAELRLAATVKDEPELGEEMVVLRRFATAKQFLTDFCANPKAAVKAWIQAQTNEEPSAQ